MRRLTVALALIAVHLVVSAKGQTPEPPRSFLLFIDDLHLDFRHTPRTRKLMQDVVRRLAHDDDSWSLVTTGTSSLSLTGTATRDRAALDASVLRVTGNGLKPTERLQANTATEMRHRAEVAYATAVAAINKLAAAPDHDPIVVLYISDGYDTRTVAPPAAVGTAAVRAHATVFTIRPSDPEVPVVPTDVTTPDWAAYVAAAQESLTTLAIETGGIPLRSPQDLQTLLDQLAPVR